MKTLKSFFFLSCLFFSFAIQAQDLEGKWKSEVPTDEGTLIILLVMDSDDTYTVDLGGDGTIDIYGEFSVDGDEIFITDTEGPEACPDETGVYKFTVSDTEFLMERVSDPCEGRGGPEGKMAFKRM